MGGSNVALEGAFCHKVGPPGITAGRLKKSLHPVRARVTSSSAVRIKLDLQMPGMVWPVKSGAPSQVTPSVAWPGRSGMLSYDPQWHVASSPSSDGTRPGAGFNDAAEPGVARRTKGGAGQAEALVLQQPGVRQQCLHQPKLSRSGRWEFQPQSERQQTFTICNSSDFGSGISVMYHTPTTSCFEGW